MMWLKLSSKIRKNKGEWGRGDVHLPMIYVMEQFKFHFLKITSLIPCDMQPVLQTNV